MAASGSRTALRTGAVAVIGLAGLGLLAHAVMQESAVALAVAVGAGAAAETQRARVRPGVAASLVNVALLSALVIGGPWILVPVALGGAVGAWGTYPNGVGPRLERFSFNFGMLAISGITAGFVYEAIAEAPSDGPLVGAHLLVPMLTAAIVFTVVNVVLVSAILWLASGERPQSFLHSLGPIVVMQPAFVAYALVAVALIDLHPMTLGLLAVPVLLSRSAYVAFEDLTEATESLLKTLISLIEQRDGYTKGHAERVADLSVMLARDLGYGHTELQTVRQAALLHDIGKICVPLEIIRKPGRLTKEEFEQIRLHPVIGARVLQDVDDLRPALAGIRHHHERIDGGGYPDGLAGNQIPEMVRIVSIADAFDAMTSTRSYRKAMSVKEALFRLVEAGGTQLDEALVHRFVRAIEREGWEPTLAPADVWPTDAEVEPVDNCCAPTLSEQFRDLRALRPQSADGSVR